VSLTQRKTTALEVDGDQQNNTEPAAMLHQRTVIITNM
jgi:hypothetical protein